MNLLFQAAVRRSNLSPQVSKRMVLGRELHGLGLAMKELPTDPLVCPHDIAIKFRADHPLIPFSEGVQLKPLIRYDFREEWNNLGYGAIPAHGESEFALTGFFEFSGVDVIADLIDLRTGERLGDYAWVLNTKDSSTLWFNRAVGPIDGYDWIIVEEFFSRYRADELPCQPVVSEIPFGFDAAVTMRIDCDEAVASGRKLFEAYAELNMPFSMAIKTNQPLGDDDRQLMKDVIAAGGSVVSHSHTHAPNWGGSRENAAWEVRESQRVLRELGVEGINYDYVVSPFHQNPIAVVEGLRDAGIRGFVGGIICNDPEFLMARAGQVPFVDGIISHSQQCMLHGECYHDAGNSISVYKQAFRQAFESRTFFGFLDHPFSSYWYGWESEEERVAVHREFLEFILSHPRVWRASLVDAMRFLDMKSQVKVVSDGKTHRLSLEGSPHFEGLPALSVIYKSDTYSLRPGSEVVFEI